MSIRGQVGVPVAVRPSPSLLYGGSTVRLTGSVTATASGTIHTWGSWAQVIASTSSDLAGLTFAIDGVGLSATDTSMLLRVGLGAAGAEVELCRFAIGGAFIITGVGLTGGLVVSLPVFIPMGTRIAVSNQALIASDTCRMAVFGHPHTAGMTRPPSRLVSIGTAAATSSGVALAAANTWYEATATTSEPFRAIAAVPSLSGSTTVSDVGNTTWDVGVGASGAEVVVASGSARPVDTEQICTSGPPILAATHIPAGSRLAVRVGATSAGLCMSLIGIPYS